MHPNIAKVRARRLAGDQGGRITFAQLILAGLTPEQVKVWIRNGTLTRTRPRVYALGYVRTDLLTRNWEAILAAGPGAYLTGTSGAHQLELINYPPRDVVVATPRDCRSLPGIKVLARRPAAREIHDGLPVAPIPELMLDLAASEKFNLVRKALASLDYQRKLNRRALLDACQRGRPGSAALRRALIRHLPQLAYTNGPLEEDFLFLLDDHHLALPRFNVRLHGILVDAYWPELDLVIELDGGANHGTAAQKRRDKSYMKILRAHGLTVVRFDSDDVRARPAATLRRLGELGVPRAE